MRVRKWIFCAAAASALWTPACSRREVTAAGTPETAFPVKIATVESRTIPVEVRAVGTVEAY